MAAITKETLVRKYVEEGKTTRQIGHEIGCSHATVSYHLAKLGIPSRGGRHDNLIDKRFGMLTVIKKADERGKWICRCDCGNEKAFYRSNFDGGTTRSCGCLKRTRFGSNSKYWKGYGGISGYVWNGIRRAARDRDLAFDIGIEAAWNLFERQQKRCALSGMSISLPVSVEKSCSAYDGRWTASLDRIDSKRGYVAGNVQWLHKDINRMKWTFESSRFIELCRACSCPSAVPSVTVDDCCSRKRSHLFTGYRCILGKTWHDTQRGARQRGIGFFG